MQQFNSQFADIQERLRATLPDASLVETQFNGCPGLRLALINPDFQTGPLPSQVMHAVIANPAYWAFCWGSGLALARYLIAEPGLVTGKTVLDVGSGSGVAGIAAALAGASEVIACDNDADALAASAANAVLSGVDLSLCSDLARAPVCDVALLADVLYDRSNLPLLELTRTLARVVIVADSRVKVLGDPGFELIHEATALTEPNLGEFDEFANVRVWRATGTGNNAG
ncbi:MAG: 50S ribosomal protein L11 methyltransferase [Pseudomonadaceae bacterium]|nr:50S ribosomal protein L11 methyltransferase [Pseudomonadaceae bacterium]